MKHLRRLQRIAGNLIAENLDLGALWVALLVVWPLVPVGNPIARDDLLPWMTLTLCAAAFLRAGRLGPGPHPMLTPRRAELAGWAQRGATVLTPAGLLLIHDAAAGAGGLYAVAAVVVAIGVIALLTAAQPNGQTAWRPDGGRSWLWWPVGGLLIVGFAAWTGFATRLWTAALAGHLSTSAFLGIAFLASGLVNGRIQHLDQRRTAGRRDGRPYRTDLFPFLLAFFGPALSWFLLHRIFASLGGLDFDQAYVGALQVVVWTRLVWPPAEPLARTVLLHEVLPVGGEDATPANAANPFDEPPEGALRFNPLQTKRTRIVHPWVVPVRGSRIADLDDPVRPLWARANAPQPMHILGEARFEPDPLTRLTQTEAITVQLRGSDDVAALESSGGEGQSRRMVILRPWLPPGVPKRARIATYAWDHGVAEEAIQIIDNTVSTATLRDGDVLVLSAEGVARAFEVELGTHLYTYLDAVAFRPPQVEDYVKAG